MCFVAIAEATNIVYAEVITVVVVATSVFVAIGGLEPLLLPLWEPLLFPPTKALLALSTYICI